MILDTWLLEKQLDHQQKLYYLVGPAHLGVRALVKRSKDADAEARGQKPADAKAGDHLLTAKAKGQDKIRILHQKVLSYKTKTLTRR